MEDEVVNYRNLIDDSNSVVNSNASFEEIKEENISFPSSNNSNSERNFLEEILNADSSKISYLILFKLLINHFRFKIVGCFTFFKHRQLNTGKNYFL